MLCGSGKKKVAIIGAGISGLTAAYYLSKRDDLAITVFEAQERIGGHAHTYNHNGVNMDTTVISFHETAYPNFVKLIRELGVYEETQPFKQELCFHSERGIEFMMTYKPLGILSKPLTIFKTVHSLKKLSRAVVTNLNNSAIDSMDFHEFLRFGGMSEYEISCLVLPMIHMFVGMTPGEIRLMPARFLVEHLYYHKLLHHSSLNAWRGWKNGTVTYIAKMLAAIKGELHTSSRIQSIEQIEGGRIRINHENEMTEDFDRVIVATPPASAFRLLKNPTPVEQRILGPWEYSALLMCIHRDESVLPAKVLHRGFWNPYIDIGLDNCAATYLVRKLHPKLEKDVMVSWAPIQKIASTKKIYVRNVEIARYSATALKTHKNMPELNEQRHGIYYCGAHFGYGWHEAGVTSGLNVVEKLNKDLELAL